MGRVSFICAFAVVVLGLLLPMGCGDDAGQQVRGQVVEVVARSFTELESLRIRDEAGREYIFITDGFVGFTPAHVKEHRLLGQSLLVTYVKRGDDLVAVALTD